MESAKAPPPTPRQEEILERAYELIRDAGLAGLTMKKVAERVGFTEPALSRHFATKQALVVAVAERLGGRLLGPTRAIAGEREVPAAARLERIVSHHVSLILETRGLPFLLLAEASAADDEVLAGTMSGIARQFLQVVTGVMRELPLPPGAPSPRELALPLLGIGAGLAIQLRLAPDLAADRQAALGMVRFLVRRLVGEESREEDPA
jgi:TetR/AcrR family transcriptional regulator